MLPKELESACHSCSSMFVDLGEAHPHVREVEVSLDAGRHIFMAASKQIHKLAKNPSAALVVQQIDDILQKNPNATAGQTGNTIV